MNISHLKNNIYGCKNLREGENVNSIMKLIEEQEMKCFPFVNSRKDGNNNIFNEIKF